MQQHKEKKLPLRKCAVCGEHRVKAELFRVVRTPEGEVRTDSTGKLNGRGVYLCRSAACIKKAEKTRRLSTALSCEVPAEIYTSLLFEVSDER